MISNTITKMIAYWKNKESDFSLDEAWIILWPAVMGNIKGSLTLSAFGWGQASLYMPPKSQIIWDYDRQNVQIHFVIANLTFWTAQIIWAVIIILDCHN